LTTAIEIRGLFKSYGDVDAVRGVDLAVEKGQVFALLGPNGAGKTTIVEILEGFRRRDAGEVSVLGFDPAEGKRALKQRMGIVLQSTGIDPYLTVGETIDMYRSGYPAPREVGEILELVGLTEKKDARVSRLSGGQQRRLDVAIALAGDPELLFLDEPTTGFDPSARRNAWEVVKSLAGLGKTIMLTTHYMDEAQYLADQVAVMVGGKIVAQGTPEDLGGRADGPVLITFRAPEDLDLPAGFSITNGTAQIATHDPTRTLYEVTGWALDKGVKLERLQVSSPNLEDTYLRLTGGAAGEEN
jgi:ABC-2 type transport system ATP-binding protein